MFRAIALAAVLAGAVGFLACSSDEDSPEKCPIVGSYTVPLVAPDSYTCPETDAGGTVDISKDDNGGYHAFIHGIGNCNMTRTDDCKLYGSCDMTPTNDAGQPLASGHAQVTWEFYDAGFNGNTYFRTEPSGADGGCTQLMTQIAKRK